MNLIGVYRACHPKAAEYTFFSNAHRRFSRIDHLLDHKASLDKIISIIFPDHNAMRLEINYGGWGDTKQGGFSGGSYGKELAYSVEDLSSIPGSGRSPGEGTGYSLQYSCLENSMDRGAWQATVHGVAKSRT